MEEAILQQFGSVSIATRSVRTAFCKFRKTLDLRDAQIAPLLHDMRRMRIEIESLRPRTKKRVRISGNNQFAKLPEIIAARNESLKPPGGA